VATVGFPDIGLQRFAPKVLAHGHLGGNRWWEVELRPGNDRGNIIGIVSAKLDASTSHTALFRRLREHCQKRDRLQVDFGLRSVFAKQKCAACYFHAIRLWFVRMKNGKRATERIELGEYIVADPEICHGKPTFKGTRIMVWQILDELAHGMTPDEIVKAWGGRVQRAAIAESVQLARHSLLKDSGELRRPKEALAIA
jgi:uncharacterized protein (DUF433 family)